MELSIVSFKSHPGSPILCHRYRKRGKSYSYRCLIRQDIKSIWGTTLEILEITSNHTKQNRNKFPSNSIDCQLNLIEIFRAIEFENRAFDFVGLEIVCDFPFFGSMTELYKTLSFERDRLSSRTERSMWYAGVMVRTCEPLYSSISDESKRKKTWQKVCCTVITKNTHWAWSNVNFNGVSYKNTSCKETIGCIYT